MVIPSRPALLCALAVWSWVFDAEALGSVSVQRAQVAALSGDVLRVLDCGQWSEGDKFGSRRLVLMRVYGGAGTEVYMQWLSAPEEKTYAIQAVRTIGIEELNNDHSQYVFDHATCRAGKSFATVTLRGTYEHDEKPKVHVFEVRVDNSGKYVLRKR